MHNKIPDAQWGAWLLTATVGPLLSIVGQNGWLTVSVAAVVCAVLCFCVLSGKQVELPCWLCMLELGWLTVFLAGIARLSGACWDAADTFPVIPIVLLLLAALASQNGAAHAARSGATLVWVILPVLGVVALAGTADVDLSWVRRDMEVPDGMLISLLLIPCLGIFLPRDSSKRALWITPILGLIAVTGSVLMDATVGQEVAINTVNSFYEFSKGVSLFGVAERFEAVVACVLTAGWFSLCVLVLSAVYHLTEKIFRPGAKWSVWLIASVSAGLVCSLTNADRWMAIGTLIFWGFLPVAAQGLGVQKKIEKK